MLAVILLFFDILEVIFSYSPYPTTQLTSSVFFRKYQLNIGRNS